MQLRIHFNEDAIQMFEYPSEASLLEDSPHRDYSYDDVPTSPDEPETAVHPMQPTTNNIIKNAPTVTGAGEYRTQSVEWEPRV